MDEKILQLTYELKKSLEEDKRVALLKELDEIMSNDIEVISLVKKKDEANDDYNFALAHFKEDSNEVKQAREKLYQAKLDMDSNKLVREYLSAYKDVKELYKEIDTLLFSFINNKDNEQ